jgi:hypothetical protein
MSFFYLILILRFGENNFAQNELINIYKCDEAKEWTN